METWQAQGRRRFTYNLSESKLKFGSKLELKFGIRIEVRQQIGIEVQNRGSAANRN